MGGPSPEKGLGNRRQLQVDTTPNRQKTILHQMLADSSFAVNRTAVVSLWNRTRLCLPSRDERQRRAVVGFPRWLVQVQFTLSLLLSLTPLGLRGIRAAATRRR